MTSGQLLSRRVPHPCGLCKGEVFELSCPNPLPFSLDCTQELRFNPAERPPLRFLNRVFFLLRGAL